MPRTMNESHVVDAIGIVSLHMTFTIMCLAHSYARAEEVGRAGFTSRHCHNIDNHRPPPAPPELHGAERSAGAKWVVVVISLKVHVYTGCEFWMICVG